LSTAPQRTTAGIATGRVLGMMAEVEIIAYARTYDDRSFNMCLADGTDRNTLFGVALYGYYCLFIHCGQHSQLE